MKPPEQSSPEGTEPSKDDARSDSRTPVARALVPSSIPEPTIRSDSSDEYARKLDNALNRPGQVSPLDAWKSLEESYTPEYYAPIEREAREKRLAFERSLAERGIVLPQGAASASSAVPPHDGRAVNHEQANVMQAEHVQQVSPRDPTVFEVKFRSKTKLILTCVAVGVAAFAMWLGGFLMSRSEQAPSKVPPVVTAQAITPLPEPSLPVVPSDVTPTEKLCASCTPPAPIAPAESEAPRSPPPPARQQADREPVKAKPKPSGKFFQKDP